MSPDTLGPLIPIVLFGGFFSWLIVRALTKAQTATLKARSDAAANAGAGQEDVLAAMEELRREVAELAERVDFTERLLAKTRDAEGKLPAGERRTGST
ncbi:MAG TPA: hypothetical protein VGV12_04375 [Gemmatimonadales bacterium]|nr:hypothetical protein [Gemmatimonadales bacterium]